MAIQINGNGTITGISVGGLPDGIVDTDMLAANAATQAKRSYGTGEIIQVVNTTKTTEFQNTNTSYVDVTGFSAAITPQTNSKVLALINIHTYKNGSAHNNGQGYGLKLVRTPSGGSSTDVHTSANKYDSYLYDGGDTQAAFRSYYQIMDSSPGGNGSTALTYKVQIANYTTALMRLCQDGNLSSLTLMEIAA